MKYRYLVLSSICLALAFSSFFALSSAFGADQNQNIISLLNQRQSCLASGREGFQIQRRIEASAMKFWASHLQEKRRSLSRGDVPKSLPEGDLAYQEQLKNHLNQVFSQLWRKETQTWLAEKKAEGEELNPAAVYLAAGLVKAKLGLDLPFQAAKKFHDNNSELPSSLSAKRLAHQSISLAIVFAASDAEYTSSSRQLKSCFKLAGDCFSGIVRTILHPIDAFYGAMELILVPHRAPDDLSQYQRNIEGAAPYTIFRRAAIEGISKEHLTGLTRYTPSAGAELEMAEIMTLLWLVDNDGRDAVRELFDHIYHVLAEAVSPELSIAILKNQIIGSLQAYAKMPLTTHHAGRRALRQQLLRSQETTLSEPSFEKESSLPSEQSAADLQRFLDDLQDLERDLDL